MKLTADGQSYTFKTDGKEYPTPWGNSAAWKALDANTWEVTNKANAKVVGTATLKLAADGKTLTVDGKNIKAKRRDFQRRGRLRAPVRRAGSGRQVEDEEPEDRLPGNGEHQPERVRRADPDVRRGEGDLRVRSSTARTTRRPAPSGRPAGCAPSPRTARPRST